MAIGISSAIASAIVTAAFTLALSMAISSATSLIAGTPKGRTPPPGIFRQSVTDSFIVYGKRRVGGLLVFFHARKVSKIHYRYFVVACAGHRCQGVTKWFLNDEQVTVNAGTGAVTSGTYAGKCWLWFQRGLASETANATFVSECGGKWTSAHKGNGIAAIYAKFEMSDAVVEAGMPNITAEIEGRDEIFDYRDDSTGYTNNAALVFYDWMLMPREEGGFGAYEDEIPDASFISAQANVCDETVNSEARYALDAVIVTGAQPSELRDVMVVNCAGTYSFANGKHLMRVGYWVPVSEYLGESDLAGPIQVNRFRSGDVVANEVQGTYVDPAAGYQGAAFGTQTTDPAPADVRQVEVDLAFITSKTRAERIARIMLNRAQAEISVVWPMNITGLKVQALSTVQLQSDRYGLSNYAWSVTSWSLSADFGVVLGLREENEEIYGAPTPVAPPSIPAISQATPMLTAQEASLIIANSFTLPTRILEASESAGSASITVLEHTRTYPGDNQDVLIGTQTITGLLTDTPYFLYYDDIDREETSPTIIATTSPETAQVGAGRHSLGRIRTPVSGSSIVRTGGGVWPTGSATGGEIP